MIESSANCCRQVLNDLVGFPSRPEPIRKLYTLARRSRNAGVCGCNSPAVSAQKDKASVINALERIAA